MAKTAIITGAGRGIGKAIAIAMSEHGFDLVLNSNEENSEIREVADVVESNGCSALVHIADISDLDSHEKILGAAESRFGVPTTLVNNAGVSVLSRGDLLDVSAESYDRCQSVNTRGAFFLTQLWAKKVLEGNRRPDHHYSVLNISSVNSEIASVSRGEYCISKAGTAMISKLFAVRLGEEGISTYDVRPGIIETPMTSAVNSEYQQRIKRGLTLFPRMGDASEVAEVVAVLAGGQFPYCTGQTVFVDGGMHIHRF
ncbi:3-oxoacyl-[acyl-carrier-protein] reductase FabG [Roseibium album]|nr:3-oxoacyl-[acyl-carrier-protein] reductase FabG [Roseibium album]